MVDNKDLKCFELVTRSLEKFITEPNFFDIMLRARSDQPHIILNGEYGFTFLGHILGY